MFKKTLTAIIAVTALFGFNANSFAAPALFADNVYMEDLINSVGMEGEFKHGELRNRYWL